METLWTGGRWTEGPAYFPAGRYLIWSDIPNDRIMRWDEMNGAVATFEQPCRNHNGHTVDALRAADRLRASRPLRQPLRGRWKPTVLADSSTARRSTPPTT
jgi:gluconolactonase